MEYIYRGSLVVLCTQDNSLIRNGVFIDKDLNGLTQYTSEAAAFDSIEDAERNLGNLMVEWHLMGNVHPTRLAFFQEPTDSQGDFTYFRWIGGEPSLKWKFQNSSFWKLYKKGGGSSKELPVGFLDKPSYF